MENLKNEKFEKVLGIVIKKYVQINISLLNFDSCVIRVIIKKKKKIESQNKYFDINHFKVKEKKIKLYNRTKFDIQQNHV